MGGKEVVALLGGPGVVGRKARGRIGLADAIARGFPQQALDRLKTNLGLTDREIAGLLGMSEKTVGRLRKRPDHPLDAVASDRLYRTVRIFAFATEVFDDVGEARGWLRSPQIGLARRVPLDLMTTDAGTREVEDLLGRIEHGVLA